MGKLNWTKRACAVVGMCAATAIALPAQTFTTLHDFGGYPTDGATPYAALIQATDGNLYGTTAGGGANGDGAVFKMTLGGTLTILYSFCSATYCADGDLPYATLVQATDGNLYGTTQFGGASSACTGGCGTVFKITPSGTLTTLHSFDSTDGALPYAGLVQGTDGNFYGTTFQGGANSYGTAFEITPSDVLTTLYSFCSQSGCTDGADPVAGLVQATDGSLYGTTQFGGASGACYGGCGTLFKINPGGGLTTLYSFCSQSACEDGSDPLAALIQGNDGNFYGTTDAGGNGDGTVFKITPSGALTTLHAFDFTDGEEPFARLAQATDGNFYGTVLFGGANRDGAIFKITPSGTLTTLYSFCSQSSCPDGRLANGGLVQDTDGSLYGTTEDGGMAYNGGYGTVFSLSLGLGAFVETRPGTGKAGRAVKVLGTNLTAATSVSFGGTAATFKVVSSSLITTTVPVGATSGKVRVVTPSGTLFSNVPFRVRP